MESLYFVLSWLCHRTCDHCYEERFHPYHGADLEAVVAESRRNYPRIVEHLPARLTYRDRAGSQIEKTASIILAGGEVLLDPVRESVLYPVIDLLHAKYEAQGGVRIIVQTTGDVVNPSIARELRALNVWTVSVSGIDAFHTGLEEPTAQVRLQARLETMLTAAGFEHMTSTGADARDPSPDGHYFHFFGATPDSWIGRLWPRGRAYSNSLSRATIEDNFCARWSGGKGFLESGLSGSEVSIEPNGNVYPCCIKTRQPIGSLLEEPLDLILSRLRGNPVYEAINAGEPDQMGLAHGWPPERFRAESVVTLPNGERYENLCIGCDRFHEEFLSVPTPLVQVTSDRKV